MHTEGAGYSFSTSRRPSFELEGSDAYRAEKNDETCTCVAVRRPQEAPNRGRKSCSVTQWHERPPRGFNHRSVRSLCNRNARIAAARGGARQAAREGTLCATLDDQGAGTQIRAPRELQGRVWRRWITAIQIHGRDGRRSG